MANNRVWYAVVQVGLANCGSTAFTAVHGLQSFSMNTRFNLESIFELSQSQVYEQIENLPDIECSLEKVLDGYPLIYHLATKSATSGTLVGRSNARTTLGYGVYTDTQDSASGTPITQCQSSGMYVNTLSYQFNVQGNFTESVSLVGNNKFWSQSFTGTTFNNLDEPMAIAGSGGVNRREDLLLGEQAGVVCKLPQDIPGVSASGYVPYNTTTQQFGAHLQSIKVSTNLGRDSLLELGRRGPYHRYAQFPVDVQTDIEVLTTQGDGVTAIEDSTSNLTNRTIYIAAREGTKIDLGSKNKLSSVTQNGGNAGKSGGNASTTFSFVNQTYLSVSHPQDPAGL